MKGALVVEGGSPFQTLLDEPISALTQNAD